jgi:hypothetical protein
MCKIILKRRRSSAETCRDIQATKRKISQLSRGDREHPAEAGAANHQCSGPNELDIGVMSLVGPMYIRSLPDFILFLELTRLARRILTSVGTPPARRLCEGDARKGYQLTQNPAAIDVERSMGSINTHFEPLVGCRVSLAALVTPSTSPDVTGQQNRSRVISMQCSYDCPNLRQLRNIGRCVL